MKEKYLYGEKEQNEQFLRKVELILSKIQVKK